jgi:hypothetical protein
MKKAWAWMGWLKGDGGSRAKRAAGAQEVRDQADGDPKGAAPGNAGGEPRRPGLTALDAGRCRLRLLNTERTRITVRCFVAARRGR